MCVSPVQLTREICGRKVKVHVPCGHCPECIKDNQNSYVIRTIEEQAKRGSLWFITLTYANEHVPVAFDADGEIVDRELVPLLKNPSKYRPASFAPQSDVPLDENENFDCESEVCDNPDDMPLDVYYGLPEKKNEWNGLEYAQLDIEAENAISEEDIVDKETGERPSNVYSLNNRDIQLWKKRVRRQIDYHAGRKVDFGYLICGEYGPRTHRPHYHGLLVGLSDEDVMRFKKDWEEHNGYTCFKKISSLDVERTARYVSKYITKQKCLEDDAVIKGLVVKPRKVTSVGYGVPTEKRDAMMRKDILGDLVDLPSFDNLSGLNPIWLDKQVVRLCDSIKYKLNGKEYKLPRYYRLRLLYVKDALTGRYRQTALSKMVSTALQDRIQKDFIRKCIELANDEPNPDDYETFARVAKIVCDSEKLERQQRAETIIQTNIAAFRKSRF